MMQEASTSETSVNFCQTTRRNIPEDSHLRIFKVSVMILVSAVVEEVNYGTQRN
jgi:hypothetical protein